MPTLKLNALIPNAPNQYIEKSDSNKGDSTAESTPKDKPTLSVVNVKAFVPTVKILDEVKPTTSTADNSKDMQESKTATPT
jgi:hypothetical protein